MVDGPNYLESFLPCVSYCFGSFAVVFLATRSKKRHFSENSMIFDPNSHSEKSSFFAIFNQPYLGGVSLFDPETLQNNITFEHKEFEVQESMLGGRFQNDSY